MTVSFNYLIKGTIETLKPHFERDKTPSPIISYSKISFSISMPSLVGPT
jgi:hypothetical protein